MGTDALVALGFLGLGCSWSRQCEETVPCNGGTLLVLVGWASSYSTYHKCVPPHHHCIHVGLVCGCHCHNLSVVLFLQHCKQYCLQLAFVFNCCCLLCKKHCLFEAQLLSHCGRVLLAFQLFLGEVCLELGPCLLCGCLVLPPHHLVFCEHFALPHLRSCHHHFFSIACHYATLARWHLEPVELREVCSDTCGWVPRVVVPGGLVLVPLRCCHLDCCFLT